jgi:hypothetical protein
MEMAIDMFVKNKGRSVAGFQFLDLAAERNLEVVGAS